MLEFITASKLILALIACLFAVAPLPLLTQSSFKWAQNAPAVVITMAGFGILMPQILQRHGGLEHQPPITLLILVILSLVGGVIAFLTFAIWRANLIVAKILDPHMLSTILAAVAALGMMYLVQPADSFFIEPILVSPLVIGGIHRLVLLIMYRNVPVGEKMMITMQIDDALGVSK